MDTLPFGSVSNQSCEVKKIPLQNCTKSKNFDDLEINDVLENIKILLNYIKKQKKKKGASLVSDTPAKELVRAWEGGASTLGLSYWISPLPAKNSASLSSKSLRARICILEPKSPARRIHCTRR